MREKGFTLIELLIVVAIILIIAAIAIPNLLRAKIAANEASAANSERTIASAEQIYNSAYPTVGFPANINSLGPANQGCTAGPSVGNGCIIDFTLGQGTKSGYLFAAAGSNPVNGVNTQYESTADPVTLNTTGVKGFCGVEDNVVRFITPDAGAPARATCIGATYNSIGQ